MARTRTAPQTTALATASPSPPARRATRRGPSKAEIVKEERSKSNKRAASARARDREAQVARMGLAHAATGVSSVAAGRMGGRMSIIGVDARLVVGVAASAASVWRLLRGARTAPAEAAASQGVLASWLGSAGERIGRAWAQGRQPTALEIVAPPGAGVQGVDGMDEYEYGRMGRRRRRRMMRRKQRLQRQRQAAVSCPPAAPVGPSPYDRFLVVDDDDDAPRVVEIEGIDEDDEDDFEGVDDDDFDEDDFEGVDDDDFDDDDFDDD